ncbi:MAG: ArnT family glycosyltransferase [Aggregatilineales bacterium]
MYSKLKRLRPYALIGVLILCASVRIGALLAFPSVFAFNQTGAVQGSDAYDIYARNLLATGVYGYTPGVPDATIPPLYSYALALVYAVFGRGYWQVGLFHTALDMLSIALLYQISKRLMPNGETVGLLAGALYALYPYLVFQNLTLIDTPIFMTLLYASVLALALLRERETFDTGTALLAVTGGVVFGLALLARPVIAPLAVCAALWFLFRLNWRQTLARLTVFGIAGLIVLTPWFVRNYTVYQAFVPVANNSGMNFWFGNSRYTIPFLRAGYHTQWATPDQPVSADNRISSGQLFAQSFDFLRQNPGQIPELLWIKFLAYWSINVFPTRNPPPQTQLQLDTNGNVIALPDANGLSASDPITAYSQPLFDQIGRTVHIVYFGTLLALALIGIALTIRQWRMVSLLWLIQISMTVVYVIFIPATRYRVPTDPLLFLFSAYTLIIAFRRIYLHVGRQTGNGTPVGQAV